MTDSEFVAHEPCDNCGSSDANAVYSDGHKFCFRCLTRTPAEGVNAEWIDGELIEVPTYDRE